MVRLVMNSKLKAGLILSVVFALGILVGYSADRLLLNQSPLRFQRAGLDPFRMEKGVVEHIEQRVSKRYGLTEEQAVRLREILEDSQLKYNAFFQETRPTFDRIRRGQREAIRMIMTPEQIQAFDEWLGERRGRHGGRNGERRGSNRHDGAGPDGLPPPDEASPAEN